MWKVFNKGCGISLFWLDYFNCNIRSWGKRRPKSRALDAPLTSLTPKTEGRKAFLGDCGQDRAEQDCGARSLVSGAAPAGRLCGPGKACTAGFPSRRSPSLRRCVPLGQDTTCLCLPFIHQQLDLLTP